MSRVALASRYIHYRGSYAFNSSIIVCSVAKIQLFQVSSVNGYLTIENMVCAKRLQTFGGVRVSSILVPKKRQVHA